VQLILLRVCFEQLSLCHQVFIRILHRLGRQRQVLMQSRRHLLRKTDLNRVLFEFLHGMHFRHPFMSDLTQSTLIIQLDLNILVFLAFNRVLSTR
jgi:hypothetical protein